MIPTNTTPRRRRIVEETLLNIYTDIRRPGALGGIGALLREARKVHPSLTASRVKAWLEKQVTYSLHKPARRRYRTKKVVVGGLRTQLQADLADMQSLAKVNDNYRYILTVIDCFSRQAFAVPLKDKTGKTLLAAFRDHILTNRSLAPVRIQVDKGGEFYNKLVKDFMKSRDIHIFSTESPYKASMVERFNRTLKEKIWKYITLRQSNRWVDILPDLVTAYNTSPHSALPNDMAPNDVNLSNQKEVWWYLYGDYLSAKGGKKPKFVIDDQVRISKAKRTFDKGYLANYTEEIFIIYEVLQTKPPSYRIRDQNDEAISGIFYEEELSKTIDTGVYLIEEVIKRRGKGNGAEIFVKWRGYPSTMNTWIPASTLLPPTAAR